MTRSPARLWIVPLLACQPALAQSNTASATRPALVPHNEQGNTVPVAVVVTGTSPLTHEPCYANCDGSTTAPILNVNDLACFLNHFAAGDTYANCDGSTTPPVLNVLDFSCFLNEFAAGCT